ncbi:MAG TPA: hypothetical protein VKV02_11915, partial [Acidobacteriaceae bacterium]|nr:hypothetical protein [Acidobacteriaceae bacterium]
MHGYKENRKGCKDSQSEHDENFREASLQARRQSSQVLPCGQILQARRSLFAQQDRHQTGCPLFA